MPNEQSQPTDLWEDLKQLITSVVTEMNHAAELRRRTGGLECSVADGETIVVSKNSFPHMYLTVRKSAGAVNIDSRMVLGGVDHEEREFRETLAISTDGSGASLRSPEGDVFTTEQAVYYILRPFLHLGTVEC